MITKEFMNLYNPTHTSSQTDRANVVVRVLEESFSQFKSLDITKRDEDVWKEIFSSVDAIKPMFGVYRSREAISFSLFRVTKSILNEFVTFLDDKGMVSNAKELQLFISSLKYEEVVNISGLENSYFKDVESIISYIDDVGRCLYYDSHKNDESPAPGYDESTMLLDEKVIAILLWNGIIPADMLKLNKYDVHKLDDQYFITFKGKQLPIGEKEYNIIKCYTKLERQHPIKSHSPARFYKKTNKLIKSVRGTPSANGISTSLKNFNSCVEEKTPYAKKLTVFGITRSNFYFKVYEKTKTSKLSVYGIIKQMTGAENSVAHCQSKEYLVWKSIFHPEQ